MLMHIEIGHATSSADTVLSSSILSKYPMKAQGRIDSMFLSVQYYSAHTQTIDDCIPYKMLFPVLLCTLFFMPLEYIICTIGQQLDIQCILI